MAWCTDSAGDSLVDMSSDGDASGFEGIVVETRILLAGAK